MTFGSHLDCGHTAGMINATLNMTVENIIAAPDYNVGKTFFM